MLEFVYFSRDSVNWPFVVATQVDEDFALNKKKKNTKKRHDKQNTLYI